MSRPPKRTQFKIDNNYIDKSKCKMFNYLNDVKRISKKRYNADYVAMIVMLHKVHRVANLALSIIKFSILASFFAFGY